MRIDLDRMLGGGAGKKPSRWSVALTLTLILAGSFALGYLIGLLVKLC